MNQPEILLAFPEIPQTFSPHFSERDIHDFFNLLKIAYDNIFVHPIIEQSSGVPMYANPQFKRLLTPENEILMGRYVYCIDYIHLHAPQTAMRQRIIKITMNNDHRDPSRNAYLHIYDNRKQFDGMMMPQITGYYHANLRLVNPDEFYVWLHVPRTGHLSDALFRRTFAAMLERKAQTEEDWARWQNHTLPMLGLELHPKNAARNGFWSVDNLRMIHDEMSKSKDDWKNIT